ncbi:MAG: acyltransferase family protein [Chitinispirillaceae bacterium]|nr:acyltransferase family protein [Chitinispirillaceae bacterium]
MIPLPENRSSVSCNPSSTVWVDLLRFFAVFSVVVLHAAVPFVLSFGRIPPGDWWAGNILDSSVRWCVPVFVMISGALLLNRDNNQSILSFYRRKTYRILIPLLFWSIFYSALNGFILNRSHQSVSSGLLIFNFLTGRPYPHLWYLYMLLGLYVLTPFLRRAIGALDSVRAAAVTIFFIVVGMLFALFPETNYETGNIFPVWSVQFLGYFIFGGIAFKKRIWEKTGFSVLIILFFLSAAATAAGCGWFSLNRSLRDGLIFYNYTTPSVAVMSMAIFLLSAKMNRIFPLLRKPAASIIRTTFGIYLIHPLFLFFMERTTLGSPLPSLMVIVINSVVCFFLSLLLTLLLRRIPVLRACV